jgi:uncharacterized protein YndB with AHSA1/START domain
MGMVLGMDMPWPWSPVEVHQSIDAPRDEVFNTITDPRTFPEWLVGAQRIRDVDDHFPAPGTKFDHSVGPTPDVTVDDDTKAIAVQGHRRLVLEVHVGPIHGEVEFTLKKRGDASTEVRMRERPLGPAAVLTPALRPVLAARNMASLRNLARLIEQSESAA